MFRRIAVHLDNGIDCRRRVEFALQMARPHDAHLTGIFASYMLPRYFYDEGGMWVRALDLVKELNTKGRMAVQAAFSEATAQAGVAASWRQGEDMPAECVVRHARHSDVLILGQENAGDVEAATGNDFVEQVLLSAGRPSSCCRRRVLPNAGARVLYCWNQSRESARAIADAAPCAPAAARPDAGPRGPGRSGSAGFLRRPGRLLRQPRLSPAGVGVPRRTRAGIGDAILSAAADFGADLIVMGAYGHSRTRQWIMGGATRSLLEAMTLPVFFLTRRRRADAGKRGGRRWFA